MPGRLVGGWMDILVKGTTLNKPNKMLCRFKKEHSFCPKKFRVFPYNHLHTTILEKQDIMVLWSKMPTLDRKVKGSNPAAANFSFEVDDLDAQRKKKKTETKTGAPANDH